MACRGAQIQVCGVQSRLWRKAGRVVYPLTCLVFDAKRCLKLKNVVVHQNFQAVDNGGMWDANTARRGSEKGGDHLKCMIGVNVGVH